MAFDEKTKRVFVEITEARILEEVKQLGVSTSTDILIKAANLAVEGLIGRIIQEDNGNLSEAVKTLQADVYEILENTRAVVALFNLANQYKELEQDLEE